MRHLLTGAAVAALLVPATAAAAPLGELPFTPFSGLSQCFHPTGAPGELARDVFGTGFPTVSGVQILQAGATGFAPGAIVPVGDGGLGCATVAALPDGTAVAAGEAGVPARVLVATRPAGGAFGAPVEVARGIDAGVEDVTVKLSPRGDALVAWLEKGAAGSVVRAVVRPAGGAFGAPHVVAGAGEQPLGFLDGVADGGEAVFAWASPVRSTRLPVNVRVSASVGFGAPQRVAEIPALSAPALAVAGDGRALLALPDAAAVRVSERAPGGAFAAPVQVAATPGLVGLQSAVALGDAGRAAVAWRSAVTAGAGLVQRPAGGAFGAPVTLARVPALSAQERVFLDSLGSLLLASPATALPSGEGRIAVTLTPDGALAGWIASRRVAGVVTDGVQAAVVPAAGGPVGRAELGGGLRDSDGVAAYPLAGGASGLVWSDRDAHAGERLHTAVPAGTRPADPSAPAVHVGPPRQTVIGMNAPLRLPIRCRAACDVRAQTSTSADGEITLAHGGRGMLVVQSRGVPVARRARLSRVRVRLLYGAPGALHPRSRSFAVRVRLPHALPLPHLRRVRATRLAGDRVRVTWTTDAGTRGSSFLLFGRHTRGGPALTAGFASGKAGRRRFATVLRHARGVRFVILDVSWWNGHGTPPQEVRVR